MTFSDAEETMNDSELPDYKEDGIDVEMHLADRYVVLLFIKRPWSNALYSQIIVMSTDATLEVCRW